MPDIANGGSDNVGAFNGNGNTSSTSGNGNIGAGNGNNNGGTNNGNGNMGFATEIIMDITEPAKSRCRTPGCLSRTRDCVTH